MEDVLLWLPVAAIPGAAMHVSRLTIAARVQAFCEPSTIIRAIRRQIFA